MSIAVELVWELGADLGEGPHWDRVTETLLFVDVTAGIVHRYDPNDDKLSSFPVGQEVGTAITRRAGGLVLALRDGIAVSDLDGSGMSIVAPIETDRPGNRMNDAKCDPSGRLFAGTMAFDFTPHAGALYRIEPDFSVAKVLDTVTISNGIGWSPSATEMYYVDSATRAVEVFDYDLATGSLSERRLFVDLSATGGNPDGLTVDAEGNVWVAVFGGGVVCCWSPEGELVEEVHVPVTQVTSCAFGGPDLSTLYVTTAAHRLDPRALAEQRSAGSLFAATPGVCGTASVPFAG